MSHLLWLEQIQPADSNQVGDQAYGLSQLLQQGQLVLPGFVISAQMFREFLETIDWLEPQFADLPGSSLHFNADNYRQLQAIARQIHHEIAATPLPGTWATKLEAAVRHFPTKVLPSDQSSASPQCDAVPRVILLRPSLVLPIGQKPAQTPGDWRFLHAQVCAVQPDALAQGLKSLWAELFCARSLFYWWRQEIQLPQINLAVLVQPLWPTTASGTLSVTEEEILIQSTWGLNTPLNRNESLPDTYRVDPATGQIRQQKLGEKTLAYNVSDQLRVFDPPLSVAQVPGLSALKKSDLLLNSNLRPYLLNEDHQKDFALEPLCLKTLIQLGQAMSADWGPAFVLEWVFCHAAGNQAQIYLSQVYPQCRQLANARCPSVSSEITQNNGRQSPTSPNPRQPPSSHSVTLPGGAPLSPSLGGLAAAPGQVVAAAHVIRHWSARQAAIPSGVVLVTSTITPDQLMQVKQVAGIVTELGGLTCHAAIVARELGIPAVVGVADATRFFRTGEVIYLDGDSGQVFRTANAVSTGGKPREIPKIDFSEPTTTSLLVNLSQPEAIAHAAALPVDGIGLLRSEFMLIPLLEREHPQLWLHKGRQAELVQRIAAAVSQFASAFAPRPVFYRSLDLRSQEFRDLEGGSSVTEAVNPTLGYHGTWSYQADPGLFDLELEALAQVQRQGKTNIRLILPFVRTVEEFEFCRHRVEQVGLCQVPDFQLWIMAEVPSVVWLLSDYVQAGVAGITIGTNDLAQLLLAADRDCPELAKTLNAQHPAVQRAVARLVQDAKRLGIPCSVCGEIVSQRPDFVNALVRWGVTAVSVNVDQVAETYRAIVRAEQHRLLRSAP